MNWYIKTFNELTNKELYKIIQARIGVFTVEQNCPYQDCDDKDLDAMHVFAMEDNRVVAYSRLLPCGSRFEEASIGRLLVHRTVRGTGVSKILMQKAIEYILNVWNEEAIRISAQEYLENYYAGLGFKTVSEEYLEDDIPHMEMLLTRDSYICG